MTKQEQFLWLVQTILLSNVANVASLPEYAGRFRHLISATGVAQTASEALRVSTLLPVHKDASELAVEFCFYMLDNLRSSDTPCPFWVLMS
jgi:hypothetical protein